MKRYQFILYLFLLSLQQLSAQYVSKVWVADQQNGTYKNPILFADYSDPDVCAVDNDFYMTASSFGCVPGLPILHSTDLVNWQIVNYALPKLQPKDYFNEPRHGKGVWAPSIRYHDGEYYIYYGDPDFGIYMLKTNNPKGKWSDPVLVKAGKGLIDPCPLWDDDGRVYLINAWASSRSGFNSILTISELNGEGSKVIGNPILVYDGNIDGNHTTEGPKLYKRNGYYYILAPAGGVSQGWQIALRSKNIYGPYDSKTVMAQGKTGINGPHQGAWVETNQKESWFIHFQDKGVYGRVILLQPMAWRENWPVIGIDKDGDGCGEPVSSYRKPILVRNAKIETPVESDDFNHSDLGLQWQWNANYQPSFGFASNMGFIRIYGWLINNECKNQWGVPNLLLQKFMAEEFTATAKVKVSANMDGQRSGIIIMGLDYAYLALERKGKNFLLIQSVCKDAEHQSNEKTEEIALLHPSKSYNAGLLDVLEKEIYLRVTVTQGGLCRFCFSEDGKQYHNIDTSSFTAKPGKWIGAKVGLMSTTPTKEKGWLDCDLFDISKVR